MTEKLGKQGKSEKGKKEQNELFEWAKAIAIAVIVAVLIRIFVFEFVVVQHESMYPTLYEGDKLCVSKISYMINEPDRGEIVIVKITDTISYVKRVIAYEGETIEIIDSIVYIDGVELDEDYLVDGLNYDDYGPYTVPEDSYFLMGDNRPYSQDSRELGAFEKDDITAKVIFRLSPFTIFSSK